MNTMRHLIRPFSLGTAIVIVAVVAVNLVTLPNGVVWAIVLTAMAISVLISLVADQRHREKPTRHTRRNPRATP